MFVDRIKIFAKAGNGGDGSISFRREKHVPYGGPDGGNGGRGGSIFLKGNPHINSLEYFYYHPHLKGNNGEKGGRKNLYGKSGEDKIFNVPIGTSVYDENMNILLEINDSNTYLLLKGGKGGIGNYDLKTHRNPTPKHNIPPEITQEKTLFLFLTLKFDVGLIGLPNSGKSSLINILSNANSVVGDYSFTTLNPVLGMLYNSSISIIDLPGIIENAHQGKGNGLKFLRHSESCKIFLHIIDISDDPLESYYKVRQELKFYKSEVFYKKHIIILNKIDKLTNKELEKIKNNILEFKDAIFISCLTKKNTFLVKDLLIEFFKNIEKDIKTDI
ncbi:Obg family GTPase CgtA [Rickettsiales bacterium (ex Bugula neritina AB1)]|nr:Obg family GTPase CgtA [Rickettsiales bacterium (ex Bugula neritina AB1)]